MPIINWVKHRNGDHEGHPITANTANGTYCDECMSDLIFNPESPPHAKKKMHRNDNDDPCTQLNFIADHNDCRDDGNEQHIVTSPDEQDKTADELKDIELIQTDDGQQASSDVQFSISNNAALNDKGGRNQTPPKTKKNTNINNRKSRKRKRSPSLSPHSRSWSHIECNKKRRKSAKSLRKSVKSPRKSVKSSRKSAAIITIDESTCFLCGNTGNQQCHLKVDPVSNTVQVTTTCLPQNTYVPYATFRTWSKETSSRSWKNPVTSDKCGFFWRYNMVVHEEKKHKMDPATSKHKLSDFELALIPLLEDKNGKCRKRPLDKDVMELIKLHKDECMRLWPERCSMVVEEMENEENMNDNDNI